MAMSKKKKIIYSIVLSILVVFLYWVIEYTDTPVHSYFYQLKIESELKDDYRSLLDKAIKNNDLQAQYRLASTHYWNIRQKEGIFLFGKVAAEPVYWVYWDDNIYKKCHYGEGYRDMRFESYKENNFSVNDLLSSKKFSCEEHNLRKAFYWAQKAAKQGLAEAQVLYALILEEYFPLESMELAEGLDIPSNAEEQVRFWIEKAGEQQHYYPLIRTLINKVYANLNVNDKKGKEKFVKLGGSILNNIIFNGERFHYKGEGNEEAIMKNIIYELNYLVARISNELGYLYNFYWEERLRAWRGRNGGINSKEFRGYDDLRSYYLAWIRSESGYKLPPVEEKAEQYFAKKEYDKAYDAYSSYLYWEKEFYMQATAVLVVGDDGSLGKNDRVQSRLAEIYFNGLGQTVNYPKAKEISQYLCDKKKRQESCNMYKAIVDKGY